MKRLALTLSVMMVAGCGTADRESRLNTLWYHQPAASWEEALPVGNGRLGAMVYGRPWAETLQMNEESLWAGCPEDGNAAAAEWIPQIQQHLLSGEIAQANALAEEKLKGDPLRIRSYQTFGDLLLTMPEPFTNTEAENDNEGKKTSVSSLEDPEGTLEYERSLDLMTGIARTIWTANGVRFEREVLASDVKNPTFDFLTF